MPVMDQVLDVLRNVGERRGKSVPSVTLNYYCLSKGALPLVGIRKAQQAQDAVGALGWRLTKGVVVEIDKVRIGGKKTIYAVAAGLS